MGLFGYVIHEFNILRMHEKTKKLLYINNLERYSKRHLYMLAKARLGTAWE